MHNSQCCTFPLSPLHKYALFYSVLSFCLSFVLISNAFDMHWLHTHMCWANTTWRDLSGLAVLHSVGSHVVSQLPCHHGDSAFFCPVIRDVCLYLSLHFSASHTHACICSHAFLQGLSLSLYWVKLMSQKIKPSPHVSQIQSHFKAAQRRASYGRAQHLHPITALHEQDRQTLSWPISQSQTVLTASKFFK